MNLLRIASVTSAAALLAGLSVASVQAQTGTFASGTFAVTAGTGDVLGTGVGTYSGILNSGATLTLTATGGPANDAFGVITEPLTNVDATIVAGANTTTITGATGNLVVTSGNLVSFNDTTLGTATTTYPGLTVNGLAFNFTATPTPAVIGGMMVAPGLTIGGALNGFGGTDGVVTVIYGSAVPEPGVVSLLAGLAVAGTGLGLRRLRQRNA